jgi:NAD+ kinase
MDFLISVGGDGTLLDSVSFVGFYEVPVIGINTGRMGFLATIAKEDIEKAIEVLFSGQFTIEDRSLISLDTDMLVDPDMKLFHGTAFGLNEFTIHKRDTSSMITVHTYIDEEYLNSYWADGLIVSTPTGSTGYSLSCGGPLISPAAKNFVITPVSPHNLNVRPMIVPDDSVISFKIEGRSEKFLISLDSRSTAVDASVHLTVRKEKFAAKLVKFYGYCFFDTLRQKLNWGLDMRN